MRLLPWAAAGLLVLVLVGQCRDQRALDGAIARRDTTIATLTALTVELRQRAAASHTRFLKVHDTLWLPARLRVDTLADTVRVPVPVVREILRAADTTIAACQLALEDCRAAGAAARRLADTLAAQVADLEHGRAGPWLTASLGAGWVFGEGVRLAPEVAVGRRFRAVGRIEAPLDSLGASRVVVEGRWTF